MTIILSPPGALVHAVVWVQEHDQPSVRKRLPDRIKSIIIQALSDPPRAHDDALEVREGGDLLHCRDEGLGGRPRDEREEAEAVQPLEALLLGGRGPSRAVRLEIVVELAGQRMGRAGREKV